MRHASRPVVRTIIAALVVTLPTLWVVASSQAQSAPVPLLITVDDPLGDNTGLIDVSSMTLLFDQASGAYEMTLTASAAAPFVGPFRVNVNLFNVDADSFFQDAVNDYSLATPTTTLTLTGTSALLRSWSAGHRVFTNSLFGTPNPPNSTLFRTSVLSTPFTTFLTNEDYVAFAVATTPAIVQALGPAPRPPTGLYAVSISGTNVTLRWTPPTGVVPATDYDLEGGVSQGETLASIRLGSTTPLVTFAAPTGAFYVRVRAVSGAVRSVPSNEIRIFVNVPTAPSPPTGLVGLVDNSAIALAWRNSFAGGAPSGIILDVSGSANASLPLGLTDTFQFVGVPAGTYQFSLRATNASGSSLSSNAVTLTFPSPCSGAPLPPTGFLGYRVGTTIHLRWDPAATGPAPSSYVLNVSGAFTGSFATTLRTVSGTVGADTYAFTVAAVNACDTSTATPARTVVVP